MNSPQKVARALQLDETAAWMPITDAAGCEAPVVKAARFGCSPEVLELLLQSGAVLDTSARGELAPLAALAGARLDPDVVAAEVEVAAPPPWLVPAAGLQWPQWSMPQLGDPQALCGLQTFMADAAPQDAQEEGRLVTARWLLRRGADATLRDEAGRTAADWAEQSGRTRLANLLRYTREREACRLLRAMETRQPAEDPADSPVSNDLACLPTGVQQLLRDFLVPERALA